MITIRKMEKLSALIFMTFIMLWSFNPEANAQNCDTHEINLVGSVYDAGTNTQQLLRM
jgi:hypothetical protein